MAPVCYSKTYNMFPFSKLFQCFVLIVYVQVPRRPFESARL